MAEQLLCKQQVAGSNPVTGLEVKAMATINVGSVQIKTDDDRFISIQKAGTAYVVTVFFGWSVIHYDLTQECLVDEAGNPARREHYTPMSKDELFRKLAELGVPMGMAFLSMYVDALTEEEF